MAAVSDSTSENIYNQLIQQEKIRVSSCKVKFTLGKMNRRGVTRVEVERDRVLQDITKSNEIFRACAEENEKKYHQSRDTPCLQPPLQELLGYVGLTEFADSILDGTFQPPPGVSPYAIELFCQLKKPDNVQLDEVATQLTIEQFQSGWKRMKEFTSAGKSGLHFGHLKVCALHTFLSNFESSLSHISFTTGYSPQVWRVGIMVMIHKKAMVDLVTKLHTIVLTEADFNFNNKLLGKLTMQHGEKNNLLAQEQYGSQKGRTAIDQALHKRLMYDNLRLNRRPGALCSNNAKSCYDRILHSIAMLAFRCLGIASPSVESILKSIQNMHHHIRTSYGDSPFTLHCNGSLVPFQGELQGNRAAPAIWVIISTTLLNMLQAAGNGAKFITPISKTSNLIVAFAFVDDTDLISFNISGHNTTCNEVMESLQQSIDHWEGGLKATGGAINPSDTWVFPINFVFDDKGDWKYDSVENIGAEFSVLDCNNVRTTLDQHEASVGKSTLGVYLAPNGNNNAAVEYLVGKAKAWRDLIRAGHLERREAWQAVESTIMKTVEYPLAALTLTEKECTKIMDPILSAALSKTSISKNFPRHVLYGPQDHGSLGLHSLHTTQGAIHISKLQEYLAADTITGHLFRTSIEFCKLHLGIGRNLFNLDYNTFAYLVPDCWIKHTWPFAYNNHITIKDNVTSTIPLLRDNDLYLMEAFINEGFSGITLHRINKCRLYLQVNTLSDIYNGYGNDYSTNAYQCIQDRTRPSPLIWPVQPCPDIKSIKAWRSAIRKTFPKINRLCGYTLGNWRFNNIPNWIWFYHPPTQRIFQRFGQIWRIWERCSQRRIMGLKPKYKYQCNAIHIPNNLFHATIERIQGNRIQLMGWALHHNNPFLASPPTITGNELLADLDEDPLHMENIINSIQEGEMLAVSDGLFFEEYGIGAAGWIIETSDQSYQY